MGITRSLLRANATLAIIAGAALSASAQVTLGSSRSFAVLGGSTVTNTGTTTVHGDLGLSPGVAVTGFPPGVVIGTIHIADGVALQAQSDANTAYNTLAGTASDTNLTGQDLGGLTLTAGVYTFASSAQLTGTLTLDAQGNDSATFIFQIGSTITTASDSSVVMINGGSGCNVYWQVGSSATLGTGTDFIGNVLALASVTLTTNTTVSGRVFALNAAVTMDSNDVSIPVECRPVVDFGPGCDGTGGVPPLLAVTSVIPGFNATLQITGGVAGSTAIVLFGPPVAEAMGCGCTLAARPGPVVLFLTLDASGSTSVTALVPLSASTSTFVVQAFVVNDLAPCGFTATNGVQITLE